MHIIYVVLLYKFNRSFVEQKVHFSFHLIPLALSTTFNCYRRILHSTKMLLPDHILRINPYADQESLLLLPWRERRRVVNALLVLSPILISVVYWWWNNTSRT